MNGGSGDLEVRVLGFGSQMIPGPGNLGIWDLEFGVPSPAVSGTALPSRILTGVPFPAAPKPIAYRPDPQRPIWLGSSCICNPPSLLLVGRLPAATICLSIGPLWRRRKRTWLCSRPSPPSPARRAPRSAPPSVWVHPTTITTAGLHCMPWEAEGPLSWNRVWRGHRASPLCWVGLPITWEGPRCPSGSGVQTSQDKPGRASVCRLYYGCITH